MFVYSENQKTVEYEDDIKAIIKFLYFIICKKNVLNEKGLFMP